MSLGREVGSGSATNQPHGPGLSQDLPGSQTLALHTGTDKSPCSGSSGSIQKVRTVRDADLESRSGVSMDRTLPCLHPILGSCGDTPALWDSGHMRAGPPVAPTVTPTKAHTHLCLNPLLCSTPLPAPKSRAPPPIRPSGPPPLPTPASPR